LAEAIAKNEGPQTVKRSLQNSGALRYGHCTETFTQHTSH